MNTEYLEVLKDAGFTLEEIESLESQNIDFEAGELPTNKDWQELKNEINKLYDEMNYLSGKIDGIYQVLKESKNQEKRVKLAKPIVGY